ncbi:hypothetical protein T07_8929 [Trichinella nelsoni]|uniref:Uncharacterized protein n=1 Tax=Trichinella nelsoni TaxID=6336 RepID=A0A0V0S569_9BILA|nr:hypothetical protein T07_8929 [Trichinella nelsoni]
MKLNGVHVQMKRTDLNIQFIPDDVDFVEKKWRGDKTKKHTENAESSGQNGYRLHGKCSIQFFTTIHAVFTRTSVNNFQQRKNKNYEQNLAQQQAVAHWNESLQQRLN